MFLLPVCVLFKAKVIRQAYYRPQRSWGKVIFSEACVKNSVHRGGGISRPTPRGRLGGLAGGAGLQAHTWGVSRPRLGVCVFQHALRQTPQQQMATAAGSTHPTGMHSCYQKIRVR